MTSITGILQEDQYTFLIISFSILLRMRTVSDKSCRENQNTHFIFNNFCFKLFRLRDNVEKYCRSGQATDGNMRMLNACWIPKATNTLRICNTYCFSIATMVARTRLNVTLHVHCLFCLYFAHTVYVRLFKDLRTIISLYSIN